MTNCSQEAITNGVDPTTPLDRNVVKTDVRFYAGGLSEALMPDTRLDIILDNCIAEYEDLLIYKCDITYCTLLATIKDLIRQNWAAEGGSSGTEITSRKEKVGGTEISVGYQQRTGTSAEESGWEKLYEYFIKNPEDVCKCLAKERGSIGFIKVTGTKQDEYDSNALNNNNRTMWSTGNFIDRFDARRTERQKRVRNRSKRFRF